MRRVGVAAVLVALLAGCGTHNGGSSPTTAAPASAAAGSAAPGSAAPGPAPAGDSKAWCARFHGDRVSNSQLLAQTFVPSMTPDQVHSSFDKLIQEEQALAAVAPAQLAGDYRVVIGDLQQVRAASEQAGWSPDAAREKLFAVIMTEGHTQAVGDITAYADDHCAGA